MRQMLLPFVFAHFERDQNWSKEGVGIGALGVGEEELLFLKRRKDGPARAGWP
jgi:hypothetical protein